MFPAGTLRARGQISRRRHAIKISKKKNIIVSKRLGLTAEEE